MGGAGGAVTNPEQLQQDIRHAFYALKFVAARDKFDMPKDALLKGKWVLVLFRQV
jgi:hypothetical protein